MNVGRELREGKKIRMERERERRWEGIKDTERKRQTNRINTKQVHQVEGRDRGKRRGRGGRESARGSRRHRK